MNPSPCFNFIQLELSILILFRCQLINLSSPTKVELDALAKSCDPSSEVSLEDCGLNLSPEELGFANIIKKGFGLPRDERVVFELYRIDVYGALIISHILGILNV